MTSSDSKPVRGRRPGPISRTTCPVCARDCAARADGRPFRHHKMLSNGHIGFAHCPGGER